jgi:hypothetical protein
LSKRQPDFNAFPKTNKCLLGCEVGIIHQNSGRSVSVRSGCIYVLATVPPYEVVRSKRYMQYNRLKKYRFTVYTSIPCKGQYTALQEYTGICIYRYTAYRYTLVYGYRRALQITDSRCSQLDVCVARVPSDKETLSLARTHELCCQAVIP